MSARVLFIGWDGADWSILDRLAAAGHVPNLTALRSSGRSGPLRSTFPPHSVAAWTSFATGQSSASHGIVDFLFGRQGDYIPTHPVTSDLLARPTLWDLLSSAGLRVVSANIPMTFPPLALNGAMIGGVFLPEGAEFTYPADLRDQLAPLGGFPINGMEWERDRGLPSLFDEAAELIRTRVHVFLHLLKLENWDVATFAFMAPDRIQHAAMHLLDPQHPQWREDFPAQRALTRAYEELDRALGLLLAEANADHVILASDHGFRSVWLDVVPNQLLASLGYLQNREIRSKVRRTLLPLRRLIDQSPLRDAARRTLGADSRIDWTRTQAYAPSSLCLGVRLNVVNREHHGTVPPRQTDALLGRLAADLTEATSPEGYPFFSVVGVREELLPGLADGPCIPDLFYVPAAGIGLATDGAAPTQSTGRKTGEHRTEGIIVEAPATSLPLSAIWDVPRAICTLVGLDVTDWHPVRSHSQLDQLDGEQEQAIADHLRGLGYLE